MPRAKHIDVVEKTKIMMWFHAGETTKAIAAKLGRSVSGIKTVIAANRDLPPTTTPPPPKERSGRPKMTSFAQDSRLKRYVMANPFKTAKELKAEVAGWDKMSVRSIQHIVQKRLQIPSRCAAKKPLLTAAMISKRIKFCKKYRDFNKWDDVMFSDESTFRLVNPRSQMVRRHSSISRYKQSHVITNVKHSPSVMVWGCFSSKKGRGSLYFLPQKTTMNGDRYMGVLQDKLFPFMKFHGCSHFLQDGAPCHKSKKVMALLNQQEFQVMDWPGNSPDLNPIENVWAEMKRKLKKDHMITSLPLLIRAIKMMWVRDLPPKYFKKLAESMPRRLQKCLANNGHASGY